MHSARKGLRRGGAEGRRRVEFIHSPLIDERLFQAVHRRVLVDGDALGAVRERGDVDLEHECIDRVAYTRRSE